MSGVPRVLIRTEGGPSIGFGHVRRCLSLAQALREQGADVLFLVNDDAAIRSQIASVGFEAKPIAIDQDPDSTVQWCNTLRPQAVVVDSYRFEGPWFEALEPSTRCVIAIEDLANRHVPVEVVVVNCTPDGDRRRPNAQHACGTPRYALLRPEFARPFERRISSDVKRVLITVGGGDPHRLTPRLIEWTRHALGPVLLDVIIGPLFDDTVLSQLNGDHPGVTYHRQPEHMRDLMLSADLAISGGGQTTYELAATGTPTIAVQVVDNQEKNLNGLEAEGALVRVGDAADRSLEAQVIEALKRLAQNPAARASLSAAGRALVDGRGAERVARAILEQVEAACRS